MAYASVTIATTFPAENLGLSLAIRVSTANYSFNAGIVAYLGLRCYETDSAVFRYC